LERWEGCGSPLRGRVGPVSRRSFLATNVISKMLWKSMEVLKPNTKGLPCPAISAKEGMNVEELKKEVYQILGSFGFYTRSRERPDLSSPCYQKGKHGKRCALSIHKDFLRNFDMR